jgi:hypothetical protein
MEVKDRDGNAMFVHWTQELYIWDGRHPPYSVPEQHLASVNIGANVLGSLNVSFYGGPAADWDKDGSGVVVYRSVPGDQTMDDIPRLSLAAAVFADEQTEPNVDCELSWLPYLRAALYVAMLGLGEYSEEQVKSGANYHDYVMAALKGSDPPSWYCGCRDEDGDEIGWDDDEEE